MKKTLLTLLTVLIVGFIACKEEPTDPDPNENNNNNNGQDTTQNNNDPKCDPDTVYFVQAVLPALQKTCAVSGCHSSNSPQAGLNLSSYDFAKSTNYVMPGDKENSQIYKRMLGQGGTKMPPAPRNISQADMELIGKWIDQGAKNNSCEE